jgi:Tol biopolymer transport system component/DNA-binding winged helix-turn-helix (wHTH) protein
MNPAIGRCGKHLYEFGAFCLDPAQRILLQAGKRVPLVPKAIETLLILVQHSGHVLTKDELIKSVWPDTFVEENNLNQHISALRRALGEDQNGDEYIETVPRLGYRFVKHVRVLPAGESDLLLTRRTSTHVVIREEEEEEQQETSEFERQQEEPRGGTSAVTESAAPDRLAEVCAATQRGRSRARAAVVALGIGLLSVVSYPLVVTPSPPEVLDYLQLSKGSSRTKNHLVTDGSYVYFQEQTKDKNFVVQLSSAGGEPVVLRHLPQEVSLLDISPSRPEVLVMGGWGTGKEGPLSVYPLPAGSPRQLGNLLAHAATWSPDGKEILYANGNELFLAGSDGSQLRRVVGTPGRAYHLRWSPIGDVVTFVVTDERTASTSLWEVSVDGMHLRSLLLGGSVQRGDFRGSWTPDGSYYIYSVLVNGRTDLWALAARPRFFSRRSDAPHRLTTGQLSLAEPVPSRDAKKVFAIGTLERVEFIRYDANSEQFIPFLSGVSADGLSFSRDGEWVAYTSYPERTLWRSRADGSQKLQLTFSPLEALMPCWSPDGRRIAVIARSSVGHWKVFLISADGGPLEQLTLRQEDEGNPTWSPDGKALIFAGAPWVSGFAAGSTAIYQMDLESRGVVTLPGSEGLWSPRWSPDGRYLVAETLDSQQLVLFSFQSRTWSKPTNVSGAIIGYSSWSRDSSSFYFNAGLGDYSEIYRVDIARRKKDRLLRWKELHQASTLGQWFTLAPDDSPLLLRDVSIREIYALDVKFP